MDEIIIERRYQYHGSSGITWTKWFNHKKLKTIEEAEGVLKKLKKEKEPKATRVQVKGEYRIKGGGQ